jgi:hypothetical protein
MSMHDQFLADLLQTPLRGSTGGGEFCNLRTFDSLPEAERALQAAWAKARKAGWTPDV